MADPHVEAKFTLEQARLKAVMQPIIRRQLNSALRRIANQARQDVPVKTGNLGRSIQTDDVKFVGPFRAEGSVIATAPYAAAVHEGIDHSYVIRPKNKQALKFEIGGRTVFAKKVVHPPMKGRPFLLNAANRVIEAMR